jgi:hypothetical protein
MVCDRDWLVHCSHRSEGMQLRAAAPLNYRLSSTAALRPPRQARFRLRRCDVPLAPSAGWSGLPKEPAFPADAVIAALMADPPTHLVSGTWSHPFNVDWESPKQADGGLAFQEKQASPFSSLFASEKTGALFRTHDRLRDALACRAPHAASWQRSRRWTMQSRDIGRRDKRLKDVETALAVLTVPRVDHD